MEGVCLGTVAGGVRGWFDGIKHLSITVVMGRGGGPLVVRGRVWRLVQAAVDKIYKGGNSRPLQCTPGKCTSIVFTISRQQTISIGRNHVSYFIDGSKSTGQANEDHGQFLGAAGKCLHGDVIAKLDTAILVLE